MMQPVSTVSTSFQILVITISDIVYSLKAPLGVAAGWAELGDHGVATMRFERQWLIAITQHCTVSAQFLVLIDSFMTPNPVSTKT